MLVELSVGCWVCSTAGTCFSVVGAASVSEVETGDNAARYVLAGSLDTGESLPGAGVSIGCSGASLLTVRLFGTALAAKGAAGCSDADGKEGCDSAGGSEGVGTSAGGRLLVDEALFVLCGI